MLQWVCVCVCNERCLSFIMITAMKFYRVVAASRDKRLSVAVTSVAYIYVCVCVCWMSAKFLNESDVEVEFCGGDFGLSCGVVILYKHKNISIWTHGLKTRRIQTHWVYSGKRFAFADRESGHAHCITTFAMAYQLWIVCVYVCCVYADCNGTDCYRLIHSFVPERLPHSRCSNSTYLIL